MIEHQAFEALLRLDSLAFLEKVFATLEPAISFVPNWHYEHTNWQLDRVMRGEIRRLIINVPPRSGKSMTTSIAWPLFVLGHDPTRRFIIASHTESLARKFSIDRRNIAQSPWYRRLFPAMRLDSSRPRDMEFTTTLRGGILATGVGGAILGRGADIVVIDDPIKALDALSEAERRRVAEFYDNTLLTRLNDKRTGAIVIVMQRLHQDDLVGHVLERDDWEVVSLPAIAPEASSHQLSDNPHDLYHRAAGELLHATREPRDVLEQVRRAQGSLTFQAQYQQDPIPPGGNVIKREWLRLYKDSDQPEHFDRVLVSWDPASTIAETSDWSVGTVWGAVGLDYYLIDLVRGRFEVPELRREIVRLSEYWEAEVTLIENSDIGRAIAQDLVRQNLLRPLLPRPRFDKEARLQAQSARFEAGQVHVAADAPWFGDFVSELVAFPNGRYDDQVDSTSQALNYLSSRVPLDRPLKRRNMKRRSIVRAGAG